MSHPLRQPLLTGFIALFFASVLWLGAAQATEANEAAETSASADKPSGMQRLYADESDNAAAKDDATSSDKQADKANSAGRTGSRSKVVQKRLSGLIGSAHDFSQAGDQGRNLCLPCHTPHLVDAPEPALVSEKRPAEPLRPYRGLGLELDGWSMMCLGCHDGVSAADVFSEAHALTLSKQLGSARLPAHGLSSHPVGIAYPRGGNEDYAPAASVEAAGLPLPDGRIQCVTCHDAHNTHDHAGMLQISNDRSRLCLSCHQL
jgi:predicted CXXCH cytochrome family protein